LMRYNLFSNLLIMMKIKSEDEVNNKLLNNCKTLGIIACYKYTIQKFAFTN